MTQTHALSRAVVREGAERWPDWWDADVHGPPHREADVRVLEELREGLRRLGFVRRRGRRLLSTPRGRELAQDPDALLSVLADDLGGGDEFLEVVATAVVESIAAGEHRSHEDLRVAVAAHASRGGWLDEHGLPPTERDVGWVMSEVLSRGVAYGLIERYPDPEGPKWRTLIALSEGGRHALARPEPDR